MSAVSGAAITSGKPPLRSVMPGASSTENGRRENTAARPAIDGAMALYALFRPLASAWLFRRVLRESGIPTNEVSTCGCLSRVIAMLRRGDMNAAAELAMDAYHSWGVTLADFNVLPGGQNPARMLAALTIPARDQQVLAIFRRWRSLPEPKNE